jgi:hypothetical protein
MSIKTAKMKYDSGREVSLGDRVKLGNGERGTVVCLLGSREFSKDYPKTEWGYLKSGILIKTDSGEVFHYPELDEDVEFLKSTAVP